MFVIVSFEDYISIAPKYFGNELTAIKTEIRKKYVNKVVKDIGLCTTLHDIIHIGDGYIYPGDGASHVLVHFRMIVFRPFIGEVIHGRTKSSSATDGLQITLNFFDDIYVPPTLLSDPSKFNEQEQLWYWKFGEHQLYMELDTDFRFRVESIIFHERPSKRPNELPSEVHDPPPMLIIAAANEAGLGRVSWWLNAEND